MDLAALALRLLLVAVFAVSGFAKLADREGTRTSAQDLGVPKRLTRATSVMLPVAELAVALALLFWPLAGAVGALVLLVIFEIAILNAMVHHRAPQCHCFGQLHSTPVGPRTFVRNLVLALAAVGIVAFGPGPGIHTWVRDHSTAEVAVVGLVILAGAIITTSYLRRRAARPVVASSAGPPVGSSAPGFAARDLSGNERTLEELCAIGRLVVVVFVDPNCGPCKNLLPSLARWQESLAASLTIVIVSEGTAEQNQQLSERYGIGLMLLQRRSEIYDSYQIRLGTPAAIAIDPDGTVAAPAVSGTQAVEELIRQMLHRPANRPASPTADRARP